MYEYSESASLCSCGAVITTDRCQACGRKIVIMNGDFMDTCTFYEAKKHMDVIEELERMQEKIKNYKTVTVKLSNPIIKAALTDMVNNLINERKRELEKL